MRTPLLFTLLLLTLPLILAQQTSPGQPENFQLRFDFPPQRSENPSWPQWQNQVPQTSNETPKPDSQEPNSYSKDNHDSKNKMKNHNRDPKNPYAPIFDPSRPNEEIPDEVLMILLTIYGTALVIALSVCGCCIYFCRKNNAESKKTKKRMQELQMMFAQSQNINVHQMNAQPNFPRTIHI